MNILQTIGKTPVVELNKIGRELGVELYVKLEGRNPSASVKDRAALWMVDDALAKGLLGKGQAIIEPTSGNMGIALAAIGAAKGIPVVLTMPETMSVERRKIIASYGAQLILTPGDQGMKGAIARAKQELETAPDKYFMPMQFSNLANALAHEQTTGPELFEVFGEKLSAFVVGVGTGGTIVGTSRYFKHTKGLKLTTYAVEPTESPVISQKMKGEALTPSKHGIQGIGAGFVPDILDLSLIDGVLHVSTAEALEFAQRLSHEEGIGCGISGGANVCAMVNFARKHGAQHKIIATVIPDSGEKYLSTALFGG